MMAATGGGEKMTTVPEGVGDAVAGELSVAGIKVHKLAVRELPRSGKPEELLAKYGIDAHAIVNAVRSIH